MKLTSVFEDKNDVQGMFEYNWNYTEINKLIEIERDKSLRMLKIACG